MGEYVWQIIAIGLGALGLGGGGATLLVRAAMREDFRKIFFSKDGSLTEAMREIFVAKDDAVTVAYLHEEFGKRDAANEAREREMVRLVETTLEKMEVRIRTSVNTEIGSLGNRLSRDYDHLQQQLNSFGKGVDTALRQSAEADRRSMLTSGEVASLATKIEGMEKNLDIRLKHVESMLELVARRSIA